MENPKEMLDFIMEKLYERDKSIVFADAAGTFARGADIALSNKDGVAEEYRIVVVKRVNGLKP